MEFIVGINQIQNINQLKKYTSHILIGLEDFSIGMNSYLTREEIQDLCQKHSDSTFYLYLNRFIISDEIVQIKEILTQFKALKNIYFIVTDIGLLNYAFKENFQNKIILDLQNLMTNTYDFNFYSRFQIYGSFLSNELSKEEIAEILGQKSYRSFYFGFGFIPLFYSRREHLKNYFEFKEVSFNPHSQDYFLKEEMREEKFRVYEDQNGFLIYRPHLFYLKNERQTFNNLNYFVFNPVFIREDEKVFAYLEKIQRNEDMEEEYDDGFLNKQIVYKKE